MGHIPNLNLPQLKHLNVSYNHLNDTIPPSLQKFSKSSFLGNSLCGFPLGSCPTHPISQKPHNGWKKSIIAIVVGGSALLFFLSEDLSGGRTVKPKEEFSSGAQEAEKNKLVFFEGCSYNFDLEDLLRASAEVLGKGSYGTAYKAALEEGVTVVVKRLKEVIVGKREFEQQMDSVGRVGQHPNVVPLRAYYYSKDEKLLVYDYIETGSLASILHGNRTTGRTPLDWNTRLKILLGTARGLAYIHSKLHAKFCHGNIKSSNIFLSEDYEPSVSNLGLAPVMNFPANPPRTIGYRAPEVIEARKFTQKSDVYSFGVLLLEMLTGKAPLRSPGNGEDVMDLPRWVRSVLREEWTPRCLMWS
ncbi:putative inactive receptor kinase [Acorus calamus]|uniref:Inactive receptor kinase n=1 Tax=Acorus calamus TaxID=4465 RepID=A0AAV9C487_ACOCL|nr:putative inactive receptor kinase [Acorus calamus]